MSQKERSILTERQWLAASRIIAAHDVARLSDAELLLGSLRGTGVVHKIGLRALMRGHHVPLLQQADRLGAKVMLDAKLFDIPKTCGDAVGEPGLIDLDDFKLDGLFRYGSLWGVTVSAFAGPSTLKLLVERFKESLADPIAVGYLTSVSQEDFERMGSRFATVVEAQVHLLGLAYNCGFRRFVCSGLELPQLLQTLPDDAHFIVPGVRMLDEEPGDQSRIVEPKTAIALAPNRVQVVIGRGIAGHVGQPDGPLKRLRIYADHIASGL